jgi:hypothetical protein
MSDHICTLVHETDGGGTALYGTDGAMLDEEPTIAAIHLRHGCETIRIRQANTSHGALFRCYGGWHEPQECDFEWPKQLDDAWLCGSGDTPDDECGDLTPAECARERAEAATYQPLTDAEWDELNAVERVDGGRGDA